MNFYGMKLNTKNFDRIDAAISEIKVLVHNRAQIEFKYLLQREIQTIVDEIVLGLHENEKITSVYDAAIGLLNTKIAVAIAKGFNTEYNLSVALNVFSYNKEVYIQAATYSNCLFEAMLNIKGVRTENLSVIEGLDPDVRMARVELWENIIRQYKDHSCMIVKIFPLNNPFGRPDYESLKFDTPAARLSVLARHKATNHYLSMYAGGGDIPPAKLMEYMDQALSKLASPEAKELIEGYERDLLQILPVITKDIVMTNLEENAPAKSQVDKLIYKDSEEIISDDELDNGPESDEDTSSITTLD